jgi:tRNA-specific 2-thiouridylase
VPTLRVLVGMSGGVDSSVAAALLLHAGFRVTGVTMRTWEGEEPACEPASHGCYGPGEAAKLHAARRVAEQLGIDHHELNLAEDFREHVLGYFRAEYLAGRTPNPCVRCNAAIKFGQLLARAMASGIGFDRFATGHYARVEHDAASGRYLLRKGCDTAKDQSYFLCRLTQDQLAACLFPLGHLKKASVRRVARDLDLGLADSRESQDFARGGHSALLGAPARPGPILDLSGNVLGQHQGVHHYTVGQRRGLGIPGPEPLYVIAIDADRAALIVGPQRDLYVRELIATDLNWIACAQLDRPRELLVRIRYRHCEAPARVSPSAGGGARVRFQEPQRAVTPGQTVVFYEDDLLVGGGTIASAPRSHSGG